MMEAPPSAPPSFEPAMGSDLNDLLDLRTVAEGVQTVASGAGAASIRALQGMPLA